MNVARTFDARVKALVKDKVNPIYMGPVLEILEDTLIDFQEDVMADKDLTPEKKGDLATVLTPLLVAIRRSRQMCGGLKEKGDTPTVKRLHNSHLT
jgi:hypothetical protein